MKNDKRILILCPSTFGYEVRTLEAVRRLGYKAEWLDERYGNDFLSKLLIRLKISKWFPSKKKEHFQKILNKLKDLQATTLLLLDPENITGDELEMIKELNPKIEIIIYTWDSFKQKPISKKMFNFSEAAYSFDLNDCIKHKELTHLPLFHDIKYEGFDTPSKKYDFSFIGTARLDRIKILDKMAKKIEEANSSCFFYLVAPSLMQKYFYLTYSFIYGYNIVISRKPIKYEMFQEIINKSKWIVDIEFSQQTGLTMRTFEVFFSGGNILTTNNSIIRYDFYDKDRIEVFDPENFELPNFNVLANKPPKMYFDKYHIDSWVKIILEKGKPKSVTF